MIALQTRQQQPGGSVQHSLESVDLVCRQTSEGGTAVVEAAEDKRRDERLKHRLADRSTNAPDLSRAAKHADTVLNTCIFIDMLQSMKIPRLRTALVGLMESMHTVSSSVGNRCCRRGYAHHMTSL